MCCRCGRRSILRPGARAAGTVIPPFPSPSAPASYGSAAPLLLLLQQDMYIISQPLKD